MPHPDQRKAENEDRHAGDGEGDQSVLIPARNSVQDTQEPFPAGTVIHHILRAHDDDLRIGFVGKGSGDVPSGIAGRIVAVTETYFQANENGGQQDRHPAGQRRVPLESGADVHHVLVAP
jgi:hypothetical protein